MNWLDLIKKYWYYAAGAGVVALFLLSKRGGAPAEESTGSAELVPLLMAYGYGGSGYGQADSDVMWGDDPVTEEPSPDTPPSPIPPPEPVPTPGDVCSLPAYAAQGIDLEQMPPEYAASFCRRDVSMKAHRASHWGGQSTGGVPKQIRRALGLTKMDKSFLQTGGEWYTKNVS